MPSLRKVGGKKGARKKTLRKTRSNVKKVKKNSSGTRKLSWIEACKKMGYMKKGNFKPIPKSGSLEYSKIRALMQ